MALELRIKAKKIILRSYIADRHFAVKHDGEYQYLKKFVLEYLWIFGPVLYLMYTNDIPESDRVATAIFSIDTALLATVQDIQSSTNSSQHFHRLDKKNVL